MRKYRNKKEIFKDTKFEMLNVKTWKLGDALPSGCPTNGFAAALFEYLLYEYETLFSGDLCTRSGFALSGTFAMDYLKNLITVENTNEALDLLIKALLGRKVVEEVT